MLPHHLDAEHDRYPEETSRMQSPSSLSGGLKIVMKDSALLQADRNRFRHFSIGRKTLNSKVFLDREFLLGHPEQYPSNEPIHLGGAPPWPHKDSRPVQQRVQRRLCTLGRSHFLWSRRRKLKSSPFSANTTRGAPSDDLPGRSNRLVPENPSPLGQNLVLGRKHGDSDTFDRFATGEEVTGEHSSG